MEEKGIRKREKEWKKRMETSKEKKKKIPKKKQTKKKSLESSTSGVSFPCCFNHNRLNNKAARWRHHGTSLYDIAGSRELTPDVGFCRQETWPSISMTLTEWSLAEHLTVKLGREPIADGRWYPIRVVGKLFFLSLSFPEGRKERKKEWARQKERKVRR